MKLCLGRFGVRVRCCRAHGVVLVRLVLSTARLERRRRGGVCSFPGYPTSTSTELNITVQYVAYYANDIPVQYCSTSTSTSTSL